MKFSVWIPLGWGTSNSKFELNLPSCSQDMHLQSLSYSLHFSSTFYYTFWNRYNSHVLWWIALKFGALLEHIRAYLQFNFFSNRIKKQSIFKISKSDLLSHLQVKLLAWSSWKSICSLAKHWRSAFWWLEKNRPRNNKNMKQNATLVKSRNQFSHTEKSRVSATVRQTKGMGRKLLWWWISHLRELLRKERRIGLAITELCSQKQVFIEKYAIKIYSNRTVTVIEHSPEML